MTDERDCKCAVDTPGYSETGDICPLHPPTEEQAGISNLCAYDVHDECEDESCWCECHGVPNEPDDDEAEG